MSWKEEAKKKAALESVTLVQSNDVVGLGTGSTTRYMVEELGRRVREEGLNITGVPTSIQTSRLAQKVGVPLTSLDEHPRLDIAIDGADQVDPLLNLIKGMGGALTREKIVDSAAERLVIIVDEGKLTEKLGGDQVVPVEVIPLGLTPVIAQLEEQGGVAVTRHTGGTDLYITDNGNYIVDVDFGVIADPARLEREIKLIPGVVENGLFIDMTEVVYVGSERGVKTIERPEGLAV
jgi:ribose 5-phosphate isomerase A